MADGKKEEPIGIANEYSGVWVRKVLTVKGERLEISVPKTGEKKLLDPMQLEALVKVEPEMFSKMIKNILDHSEPHSH